MRFRTLSRHSLSVLIAVLTLAGILGVFAIQNGREQDAARSTAVRRAGAEAVALQRQLDRALNAPIALAAYIQLNDGRIDGFVEFTDRMRSLVPSITNLQLAPDGVVQYIHPLEGNEAAIGHELLVDRERSTEAFAAVDSGMLTLAGPFELVQGGTAMVGRQPIYLPGAGNIPGLDPDFWGFATVLVNLDDFFAASRIGELRADGYDYELAKFDRDADGFVPFRSSGTMQDPVQVEVAVANGTWRLSVGRAAGWGSDGWTPVQLLAALAIAAAAGTAWHRFQRRDERLVAAVDQRTAELRDAVRALRVARDAAERANASKTAFLANVSHELRTPMNAILGFAELIDVDDLDESDGDSLLQIRIAGDRLLRLINQVLDITAIESGHLQLDLEEVRADRLAAQVADLLAPLATESGVSLRVAGDEAIAVADPGRLHQVVSNLAANAVRFTPDGGEVVISTRSDDDGCEVSVSDTGVGISAEHLATVFDAFDRGGAPTTVEGTGMGLAIVERLVTAMGGRVDAESVVGAGSTFTVRLPGPTAGTTTQTTTTTATTAMEMSP